MDEQIAHPGKVTAVSAETVTVSFTSRSACASCHAASLCTLSDVKDKTAEVPNLYGTRYQVGDEVEVVLGAEMGLKASMIAYALPVLVLLGTVLCLGFFGVSELWSGLAGIGSVALYYLILKCFFRGSIAKKYVFHLK